MMKRLVIFATCLLPLAPVPLLAQQMYRYVNDEGTSVVAYQVPPEYVARGYEILNQKGVLIDVVPPVLGPEERARMSDEQRREEAARAERERLRKWDESLLLRYSTVEDIEAARERALRDLRIRVSILRSKQRSLRQQIESYQAQAADQERSGQPVSQDYLQAISDLREEMALTERSLKDREGEIAEVEASFQKDIDRFRSLLEIVEMRRAMARGQDREE
jgi:hypothetical protein